MEGWSNERRWDSRPRVGSWSLVGSSRRRWAMALNIACVVNPNQRKCLLVHLCWQEAAARCRRDLRVWELEQHRPTHLKCVIVKNGYLNICERRKKRARLRRVQEWPWRIG